MKALEDSLCKRVIVTPDETITKWLDPQNAALSRDALAKIVYSRLFDWYVLLSTRECLSFMLHITLIDWAPVVVDKAKFLDFSGLLIILIRPLVKILTQSL